MAAGSLKLPQGNHAGCLSTTPGHQRGLRNMGGLICPTDPSRWGSLLDRVAAGAIILKIQGQSYRAHGQGREKENIQRNKKALATSLTPPSQLLGATSLTPPSQLLGASRGHNSQLAITERNHDPGPHLAAEVDHFFAAADILE